MTIYTIILSFLISVVSCDAAEPWQLGVQDPATPVMEGMIFFHNYLLFFLTIIGVFIFWLLSYILINFNQDVNPISKKFTHSSNLEIAWTILPAILLIFIAIPSFALLYSLDEVISPQVTMKAIGHQWYWSYEYDSVVPTFHEEVYNSLASKPLETNFTFDSYMIPTNELAKGTFRLLEVDNRVILPTKSYIRVLVTAADVLHSWAIPSFGIKMDACPGRLSEVSFFIKREGVYYGQCSEICGVNHGFMPIVVRAVSEYDYLEWCLSKIGFTIKNLEVLEAIHMNQIIESLKP